MRFEVQIVRSGDGATFILGQVDTLDEASGLLCSLDIQWGEHPHPEPVPEGSALAFYEGCDAYVRELEPPHRWYLQVDDDAWELDLGAADGEVGATPAEGWRDNE